MKIILRLTISRVEDYFTFFGGTMFGLTVFSSIEPYFGILSSTLNLKIHSLTPFGNRWVYPLPPAHLIPSHLSSSFSHPQRPAHQSHPTTSTTCFYQPSWTHYYPQCHNQTPPLTSGTSTPSISNPPTFFRLSIPSPSSTAKPVISHRHCHHNQTPNSYLPRL